MNTIDGYAEYLKIHVDMLGSKNVKIKVFDIVEVYDNEYNITFSIKDKETVYESDDMQGNLIIKANSKEIVIKTIKEIIKKLGTL